MPAKPSLPYYVLNQFDSSLPLHLDVREVLREQLGERLLPFALRRAPAVSEALAEGMTVMDYAPNSAVAETFAASRAGSRASPRPQQLASAACAGASDDGNGPLAGHRGRGELLYQDSSASSSSSSAAVVFCFLAILPLTWPQQAVLGLAQPCCWRWSWRAAPTPTSSRSP